MIIGCWNVRGLNDPRKHSALRRLTHQERIALFGLVETRVRDKNKDNVSQLLLRNWSFLFNYDFSCCGRIWVCWNADTVKVDVFGMSDQAIHVSVTNKLPISVSILQLFMETIMLPYVRHYGLIL